MANRQITMEEIAAAREASKHGRPVYDFGGKTWSTPAPDWIALISTMQADLESVRLAVGGFAKPAGGNLAAAVDLLSLRCAGLENELKEWVDNAEALLESDEDVVRMHEGGGPENLVGSVCISVVKARKNRDAAREALEWYREQASSMARYASAKPANTTAMMAITQALALDAGERANAAMFKADEIKKMSELAALKVVDLEWQTVQSLVGSHLHAAYCGWEWRVEIRGKKPEEVEAQKAEAQKDFACRVEGTIASVSAAILGSQRTELLRILERLDRQNKVNDNYAGDTLNQTSELWLLCNGHIKDLAREIRSVLEQGVVVAKDRLPATINERRRAAGFEDIPPASSVYQDQPMCVRILNDNGKRWRVESEDARWEIKPTGYITAAEAKDLCERIAAALAPGVALQNHEGQG